MSPARIRHALLLVFSFFGFVFQPTRAAEILPPGFRPLPLGVHALVGGKVVIKPGEFLDEATVVIRDGLIEDVGADVKAPADAVLIEGKDLTLLYDGKKCIHARFCVTGAPKVFLANVKGPWIQPDAMNVAAAI